MHWSNGWPNKSTVEQTAAVASGELTTTLVGHEDGVFSVPFSQDGTRIAWCSADKTVRLW
jgi:WD40 repeat protein